MLAQGLAQGQGYRLTSSAVAQILPAAPPGFPAILSLVFRISPSFPDNVVLLKSVSIAAMIGVGLAAFWYFARVRGRPWPLALAIAVATIVTPAFVFLATSTVMAECVFTLGQLITVIVLARAARGDGEPHRGVVVVSAVLATATFLVRATGAALLAACVLFLVKERRWRSAALFVATVFVCYAPWFVYVVAHQPTAAQRVEHGGSMAYAYGDLLQARVGGTLAAGRATLGDLRTRVKDNAINLFGRDVVGMLAPALLRGPDESGLEVVSLGRIGLLAGSMGNGLATMVISSVLGAIALFGWFRTWRERAEVPELLVPLTIVMIIGVPVWTFRYMVPLAPFVIGYFLEGLRTGMSDRWQIARLAAMCVIGLDLYDHARYTYDFRDTDRVAAVDWVADSREVDELLAWMRSNLVMEGNVATSNPPLVYLVTGRKTVAIDDCADRTASWRAHGVRYVVSLRTLDLPTAPACGPYRVLYQSARRHLWIIEI